MRTNIEIDDKLMKQAMKASGAATKKAAVEAGLRMLVKSHAQQGIRNLFGKVQWEGDLEDSRTCDKWFGIEGTWPEDAAMPRPEKYMDRPSKLRGAGKAA
ncbi:MAG: type II toxin-antitoxin system VapB family antitoxin [Acidobacteriota bacterium]